MTQDERWLNKYQEVMDFIKTNHRNPSRHDPQERYKYLNWMKYNKKIAKCWRHEGGEGRVVWEIGRFVEV